MRFEFATAARIIFGPGTLAEIGPLAAEMGSRVLVVIGKSADRAAPLVEHLDRHGVKTVTFPIYQEPTVDLAEHGVQQVRRCGCDVVLGFGGGSAIDAAKAIAALATNPGEPLDYLEVIGHGKALTKAPLPAIAIPTTAGTGAEVTRNAVLASPEHRVKVSLRSPLMLPRLALVDPELTFTLPPDVTAATGLDALTQLIEPFVSVRANPMTDAICRDGLGRVARSLRRAFERGDDAAAREDMALASLFGGLALANAGLGAVHGFAGPFGGMFEAPHGAVCAALLPGAMAVNVRALEARDPQGAALARYAEIARILTGRDDATPADGAAWVADLVAALDVPGLDHYGLTGGDIAPLVEKSAVASSMKGNPIALTEDEMRQIVERAR